jgi:hypothetical protein
MAQAARPSVTVMSLYTSSCKMKNITIEMAYFSLAVSLSLLCLSKSTLPALLPSTNV